MRVEPHAPGSILHIVQRGTRGSVIAPTLYEKSRFLKLLFYLNSSTAHPTWERDVEIVGKFIWPRTWNERMPLVEVLAWTLMPNHFHLILRELAEGGIAKFMQRLCGSMTTYFNVLHNEKGTLFQGSYKGRLVVDDEDLRYAAAYVMGKNVLELFPGGIEKAIEQLSEGWNFAKKYEFSSLKYYANHEDIAIFPEKENVLKNIFETSDKFKIDLIDMVQAWGARNSNIIEDEDFVASLT